jgi:primosomal protein N'
MELDEELSCPICSEYYREAITVPCGHTFCRECLIKSTREKPVCPVCRSIFLRYRGLLTRSAARDMKENITISNIVRRVKGRNSQHEPVPEPRKRSVQGT